MDSRHLLPVSSSRSPSQQPPGCDPPSFAAPGPLSPSTPVLAASFESVLAWTQAVHAALLWSDDTSRYRPPAPRTIVDNYSHLSWDDFNPHSTFGYFFPRGGLFDSVPASTRVSSTVQTPHSTPAPAPTLPAVPVPDISAAPNPTPGMDSRKRAPEPDAPKETKRARLAGPRVDEVVLVDDDDTAMIEKQAMALLAAQRGDDDEAPKSFSEMTCIICMDTFTDLTATPCGHIFCHECLTQALMAGERTDRGNSSCPVCRKTLKRTTKNHMIPLSFMTKSKYAGSANRIGL